MGASVRLATLWPREIYRVALGCQVTVQLLRMLGLGLLVSLLAFLDTALNARDALFREVSCTHELHALVAVSSPLPLVGFRPRTHRVRLVYREWLADPLLNRVALVADNDPRLRNTILKSGHLEYELVANFLSGLRLRNWRDFVLVAIFAVFLRL